MTGDTPGFVTRARSVKQRARLVEPLLYALYRPLHGPGVTIACCLRAIGRRAGARVGLGDSGVPVSVSRRIEFGVR